MSKEVAKKEEAGALQVIDFTQDIGAGFEEADSSSYAIPFLYVLQSNSPQCKKTDGAYIKGAEEGAFYNTVTQEVFSGDVGVLIVPCHYTRSYNEWKPRDDGGGLAGVHTVDEAEEMLSTCEKDEKGRDVLPCGNTLVDTRNHYCLLLKPGGDPEPVFIPMSSTQIKKSKRWMTVMNNIRIKGNVAPMFSQIYKFTTIPEKNDQYTWAGLKIEHVGVVDSMEVYQSAKSFREMVRSGAAKPTMHDIPVEDEASY